MPKWNSWLSSKAAIITSAAILFSFVFFLSVQAQPPAAGKAQTNSDKDGTETLGELIYVPIYSSIFYENGKSTMELAATLYIHNVNPDRQMTVIRADYFDTSGKLIKKYLEKPLTLNALQTKSIVIDKANTAGGTGANFLVEWQSPQHITGPLTEAVMVNASSNLGIAFTTAGKVIRQSPPAAK